MPDTKISALNGGTKIQPAVGDVLPLVRSGVNYPVDAAHFMGGRLSNVACAIGDSITELCEITSPDTGSTYWNWRGYLHWMNALLGQRFYFAKIDGTSGAELSSIANLVSTSVIPYSPKYCFVEGGINDINNGQTFATMASRMTGIIQTLRRANIIPIINCVFPSAVLVNTAAKATVWSQYNAWLKNLPRYYQNDVIVIDTDWPWLDTADVTIPTAQTAYHIDGTHPTPLGAYVIGARMKAVLDPIIPPAYLPYQTLYNSSNTDETKIFINPYFTGSGGSTSTGVTGTIPASWNIDSNGSPTSVVASLVARTDAPGNWCQVAYTGDASYSQNNDYVTIYQNNRSFTSTGIAVGDTIQAFCDFQMDASPTNFRSIEFYYTFQGATTERSYFSVMGTDANMNTQLAQMVLAVPPRTVPVGATGISINMRVHGGAASSAFTARFGRPSVRKIDTSNLNITL